MSRWSRYTFYKKNRLEDRFKNLSPAGLSFIQGMLTWNPDHRMSVKRALLHPYLYESPLPKLPDQISVLPKLGYYRNKIQDMIQKKLKIK